MLLCACSSFYLLAVRGFCLWSQFLRALSRETRQRVVLLEEWTLGGHSGQGQRQHCYDPVQPYRLRVEFHLPAPLAVSFCLWSQFLRRLSPNSRRKLAVQVRWCMLHSIG